MGHLGDRVGRKSMLVLSLLLVGLTTVAIGLLPTYAQIGVWAPIGLVILRLLQGFGLGGEWSGAVLMSVEHAPPGRRGLYGIFPQMGVPLGLVLANLAFLGVSGSASFTEWAWRLPFLLSAVLVVVGLFVRLKVTESPAFAELTAKNAHSRRPLVEVVRRHRLAVLVAAGLPVAPIMITYIVTTYTLSHLTTVLAADRTLAIVLVLVTSTVYAVSMPLVGLLCDRVSSRAVLLAGLVALAGAVALYFPLVSTLQPALMMVAGVAIALGLSATFGPVATMISDLFPAQVRFSGTSLGYQVATLVGGAPAPFLAVAIFDASRSSTGVTAYMLGATLISLLCAVLVARVRSAPADWATVRRRPAAESRA
jgi:MFS family permease